MSNFIAIDGAGWLQGVALHWSITMLSCFRLKNNAKSEPDFDKIVNRFSYFEFEIGGGIKIFSNKILAEKY